VGDILNVTAEFLGKKNIPTPRLDAELLLGRVLGLQRVQLYVNFERLLEPHEVDDYRELVRRRSKREPAAYILGEREFYAIPFIVTGDVLIPRPETEILVDEALSTAKRNPTPAELRVCDVGTGCGCIAAALARNLPGTRVEASDMEQAALDVARRNLEALDLAGRVTLVRGDLMDAPFASSSFDIVCANLPYVPSAAIPELEPDVRDYEPHSALDGGPDGLDPYRRFLPQAAARLAPGGTIVLECQPDQFAALIELALSLNLAPRPPVQDLSGRDRIFSASRP
jgi:release factor glutamine methyltransferase